MTVKKLGFGLMRLPLLNSDDQSSVDIETVKKMADLFLANGFRGCQEFCVFRLTNRI